MSGFFDRFGSGSNFSGVTDSIRRISKLGMKYDDMVIKNSKAIGPTEASAGVSDYTPRETLYALAMADVSQKKYVAYYDKDYAGRRDYLRKFTLNSEIDWMVTTITDEAIVYDETNYFAYPSTALLDISDAIKDEISDEFKRIYNRFGFVNDIVAWHMFRQFLVDGTLAFEIVYEPKGKKIIGFKELDAAVMKSDIRNENGVLKKVWYVYPDTPNKTRMLYDTQVIYISYAKGNLPSRVSYCENLVRSFNLLRVVENAMVMWYLMNSMWRLKMIVPIGTKSPQKAKESLGEMMSLYKEDLRINSDTGELTYNGSPTMQYYKNYLFPSKNGESVTIENMSGDGPDVQQAPIVNYFQNKLKDDSKIPSARFDKTVNGGQLTGIAASGVDREEIRFYKFVNRLRSAFQEVLVKPIWIQLCINHPELEDDEIFKSSLGLRWTKDNVFEEIRMMEIMSKRVEFISSLLSVPNGTAEDQYFPTEWAIENYMHLDKDILDSIKRAREKLKKEAGGEGGAGGADAGLGAGGDDSAPSPEGGGDEGSSLGF